MLVSTAGIATLLLATAILCAPGASADTVLLDTLSSGGASGATQVGQGVTSSWKITATSSGEVNIAKIRLGDNWTNLPRSTGASNVIITLLADAGGNPSGTSLGTFNYSSYDAATGVATYRGTATIPTGAFWIQVADPVDPYGNVVPTGATPTFYTSIANSAGTAWTYALGTSDWDYSGSLLNSTTYGAPAFYLATYVAPVDPATPTPEDVLQQVGVVNGQCAFDGLTGLNASGVDSSGWTRSWAQWVNHGTGGEVCSRTLYWSADTQGWKVR